MSTVSVYVVSVGSSSWNSTVFLFGGGAQYIPMTAPREKGFPAIMPRPACGRVDLVMNIDSCRPEAVANWNRGCGARRMKSWWSMG